MFLIIKFVFFLNGIPLTINTRCLGTMLDQIREFYRITNVYL